MPNPAIDIDVIDDSEPPATIISEFELGFAPNQWDGLFRYLQDVENIPINLVTAVPSLETFRKVINGKYLITKI